MLIVLKIGDAKLALRMEATEIFYQWMWKSRCIWQSFWRFRIDTKHSDCVRSYTPNFWVFVIAEQNAEETPATNWQVDLILSHSFTTIFKTLGKKASTNWLREIHYESSILVSDTNWEIMAGYILPILTYTDRQMLYYFLRFHIINSMSIQNFFLNDLGKQPVLGQRSCLIDAKLWTHCNWSQYYLSTLTPQLSCKN